MRGLRVWRQGGVVTGHELYSFFLRNKTLVKMGMGLFSRTREGRARSADRLRTSVSLIAFSQPPPFQGAPRSTSAPVRPRWPLPLVCGCSNGPKTSCSTNRVPHGGLLQSGPKIIESCTEILSSRWNLGFRGFRKFHRKSKFQVENFVVWLCT